MKASLKPYNTFGINVSANEIIKINHDRELKDFFLSDKSKEPFLVLGEGANILFTKDFDGTVLNMETKGIEIVSEDSNQVVVRAKAGENWDNFVRYVVSEGYGGLENLALIPGKVGGSPIQNIGAYGREVKDCISKVYTLSVKDASVRIFSNKDCCFGYRSSIFKGALKGQYVITDVEFVLQKNGKLHVMYEALQQRFQHKKNISLQEVYDTVSVIRNSKLPDYKLLGNAGSFFKNPVVSINQAEQLKQKYPNLITYPISNNEVKLAAGQLIDISGWKGKRIGNVGVHPQQALVLVNYGNATGMEVLNLAHEIQKDVFSGFRVNLEMEVNIL